jgi:hypothetical protein
MGIGVLHPKSTSGIEKYSFMALEKFIQYCNNKNISDIY